MVVRQRTSMRLREIGRRGRLSTRIDAAGVRLPRYRPPVRIVSLVMLALVLAAALGAHKLASRPAMRAVSSPAAAPIAVESAHAGQPASSPLDVARRSLAEGDDAGTLSTLRPLLGGVDSSQSATALLLTARAQLGADDQAGARGTLERLIADHPNLPAAGDGEFLRAQLLNSEGNTAAATSAYQTAAKLDPDLAPYAGLRIVAIDRAAGRLDAARRLAQTVADSTNIRGLAADALEQVRAIQTQRGDEPGYLATTKQLLSVASLPTYQAQLTFQAAQAELKLGQTGQATQDLVHLVRTWPTSSEAASAMLALSNLHADGTFSLDQRGQILYDGGQYLAAINVLTSAVQANSADEHAWYLRAMARMQAGNAAMAAEELREMASRFSSGKDTPGGLIQVGKLDEQLQQLSMARDTFQIVLDRYGSSGAAAEARFQLGLLSYLQGDVTGAARVWQAAPSSIDDGGEVAFWLAKAKEALGDRPSANAALHLAARQGGDDTYGLLARDALQHGSAAIEADQPTTFSLTPSQADVSALSAWFSRQGKDASALRASMQQQAEFQRASKLLDLGLTTEAEWEFDALADAAHADPARLAVLAGLVDGAGDFAESAKIGQQAVAAASAKKLAVPRLVDQLRFPIPYPDLIMAQAKAQSIDPLLLAALIRQESAYDPKATSPAGALGLTQMMPATGATLARGAGLPGWTANDLYRPKVSIELGAIYLAGRLKRYKGAIIPALAAYNAGDGVTDGWLYGQVAADPDLLTETIPYPETRDYVSAVLKDYLEYQRLYMPPDR